MSLAPNAGSFVECCDTGGRSGQKSDLAEMEVGVFLEDEVLCSSTQSCVWSSYWKEPIPEAWRPVDLCKGVIESSHCLTLWLELSAVSAPALLIHLGAF